MADSGQSRVPRWVYHFRNLLAMLPLVFAVFSNLGETSLNLVRWPVGVAVVLLGVLVRIWAQEHIRFRLNERRHLAITGPYQLMRNPLYVGNTVICLGLTVASGLLWLVPVTLVWCALVYSLVVRYEEARVLAKYGESSREFFAAVPRWLPRSWKVGKLELVNAYFGPAFRIEVLGFLTLVPLIVKHLIETYCLRT